MTRRLLFLTCAWLVAATLAHAQTETEVSPGGSYKVTWQVETGKPAPDTFRMCVDGACTLIPGGATVREATLPSSATEIRADQITASHLVEINACRVYPAPRNDQCLTPPDPVTTLIVQVNHGRAINITIVTVPPPSPGARTTKPRE